MRRAHDVHPPLASELTLRECRNRLGLSQRQMAVRLGVDRDVPRSGFGATLGRVRLYQFDLEGGRDRPYTSYYASNCQAN